MTVFGEDLFPNIPGKVKGINQFQMMGKTAAFKKYGMSNATT